MGVWYRLLRLKMVLACLWFSATVAASELLNHHIEATDGPLVAHRYQFSDANLRVVTSGNPQGPAVLFLHGAPGGWHHMSRYVLDNQLRQVAHLAAVDRPGWGDSILEGRSVERSWEVQSAYLRPLLEDLNRLNQGQGVVVVGHSLGASLAPRLALDHPDLVSGMVLLAGSHSPKVGGHRWYNTAASLWLVCWAIEPELLQANREILKMKRELRRIWAKNPDFDIPVTAIQGLKDKLVFPKNVAFLEQRLDPEQLHVVRIPDEGHFIPWTQHTLIRDEILALLNRLPEPALAQR